MGGGLVTLLLIAAVIVFIFKMMQGSNDRDEYEVTIDIDNDDRDAWEGGFWDVAEPKNVEAVLEFDYKDSNGNKSNRVVHVRRFEDSNTGLLIGHCELRDSTRTFRLDRISKIIDADTGEVVRDVRAHLNAIYDASPNRVIDKLMSHHIDVAKVLFYVVKADGQYRKEEKVVVTDYLRRLLRDDRITPELVDQGLHEIDVPSLQGFKIALGRAIKGGEVNPSELQKCCHDIVATQKSVHPAEQAALDYIDQRIAKEEA